MSGVVGVWRPKRVTVSEDVRNTDLQPLRRVSETAFYTLGTNVRGFDDKSFTSIDVAHDMERRVRSTCKSALPRQVLQSFLQSANQKGVRMNNRAQQSTRVPLPGKR